jgi:hypothetical protein
MIIFLVCFSLLGCEFPKEIKRIEKTYEVIEIKKPKRFKVSLKDIETGVVYKMVSVSKRCSNWQKLKIGSQWKFDEVTYKQGDSTYTEISKVNELCWRLSKI